MASTYPCTLSSLLALQQRVRVKKRMMPERPADTPKNRFWTNLDPGFSFSMSMSTFSASELKESLRETEDISDRHRLVSIFPFSAAKVMSE